MEDIEQAFMDGFSAKQKQTDKILLDTLNKYRSYLSNEETPKLAKTANFERITSYKAYIEVIQEIMKKLKSH